MALPLVAHQALPALPLQLNGGRVPIRSIIIDCTLSPVGCNIYQGTSAQGSPIVVAAGAYRCIPLNGTAQLYVTFPTTPNVAGNIYVAWSDQEQQGYGTNVAAIANFPNPLPISGTVAVSAVPPIDIAGGQTLAVNNFPATQPVSGTLAVNNFPATQPISGTVTITPFPTGAAPTAANIQGACPSPYSVPSTWLQVLTPTLTSTQNFYLTGFWTSGFDKQPWIRWSVLWATSNVLTYSPFSFMGDVFLSFPVPIMFGTANIGTGTNPLGVGSLDTIRGTLNVCINASGYIL